MKFELYTMNIIEVFNKSYKIFISDCKDNSCYLLFNPETKEIKYKGKDHLTQVLKLREFQLRKLLHNKKPSSFYVGFKLNFVLHNGLPNPDWYDKNKITVIDNTKNLFDVYKTDAKTKDITELYTDGSFNHTQKIGAFAIFIKYINGSTHINQIKTNRKGNNLIELLAVIHGLEHLKETHKIRITTDSQYVIKGATEWIVLWKLNNFVTANGDKAKNIEEWKKLDALIQNKYIEFEWVKSHSKHFENTICHNNAKSLIRTKNEKDQ